MTMKMTNSNKYMEEAFIQKTSESNHRIKIFNT